MSAIKQLFSGRRRDVDMTEGNIVHHLIAFAIPLLVGNIFQQLYNTVDTWVVHHPGVYRVVKLLENVPHQQGDGEGDQVVDDVPLGHVHVPPPAAE